MVESGKWNCDRCRYESLQLPEEKLQNIVFQIDELKRKNRALVAGKEVGSRVRCR